MARVLVLVRILVGQAITVLDEGVIDAMGHHVHGPDAKHGAIHVVTEEHMVHVVILLLAVEEDLLLAAFLQVFARRHQKAGGAAGRVADDIVGLRVHQLHHHANDMPRRAELAVPPGLADFAEQVFVSIATHIRRLRFAHQAVNLIQRVHHLGEQQRRGQHEDRVVHVLGIGAVLVTVEVFDEGKHPVLHDGVHFCGREIVEHAPLELLSVDGAAAYLHLTCEDALIRQAQHICFLGPEVIGIVQIVDEHQIGDLLNDTQRVHKAARRKSIPKAVDFVFQFACNHSTVPFSLSFLLRSRLHILPAPHPCVLGLLGVCGSGPDVADADRAGDALLISISK